VLTGGAAWQVPVDFAIVAFAVAGLSATTYLAVERPALGLRRTRAGRWQP
jgi:hypothetical protein